MAVAGQNWNNILSYIKMNLGAPVNLIEIPDNEIIEMLREHVLPVFSQYCPFEKWVFLGPDNLLPVEKPGQPLYRYKIPHEKDEPIIDVIDVITGSTGIITQEYGMIPFNTAGITDTLIANSYMDAIRSLGVRQTWQLIPPDILIMDVSLKEWSVTTGGFLVCNYTTIHKTLDTIESDFHYLSFKDFCLGKTMIWLAAIRSKYENLTTPFGALNINWQKLQDDGNRLVDEQKQFFASIPPNQLVVLGL